MDLKPGKWKLNFRGGKDKWLVVLAVGMILLILAFPVGGKGGGSRGTGNLTAGDPSAGDQWSDGGAGQNPSAGGGWSEGGTGQNLSAGSGWSEGGMGQNLSAGSQWADSGVGQSLNSWNLAGSGSGLAAGNGTGTESGNGAGNGTGTESGNGVGNGTGTESGNGVGNGTGAESGNGAGNGAGTESGNGAGARTGTESGSRAGNGTGTESVSGAGGGSLDTREAGAKPAAVKGTVTYEQQLEERLKELLSHVEGVGKVEVMIVLKSSEEKVWRVDRNTSYSSTQETDANGGTRDIRSQETTEGTILSGQSGGEGPLLEKEMRPEISGVVVTADGGGSPTIQAEISAAVEALFDVPSHKIKVLKRAE